MHRRFFFNAALGSALLSTLLYGETLGQVLTKNRIPTGGVTRSELNQRGDFGQLETIGGLVVLAYPTVDSEKMLAEPLHVFVYDRVRKTLARSLLSGSQVSDECFGSVLGIRRHAERFLVSTHINPSASCTLVLDGRLRWRKTLMGWPIGTISPNEVVFQEDEVHFAPVHPL